MEFIGLARKISDAGGRLYVVGGAVRDLIMENEPHDYDYCVTGIDASTLQAIVPDAILRGKAFPVFDYNGSEIALARKEIKTGKGHKLFEINSDKSITIEEDLARRDITINSIAMDVLTKEIIDPFNGRNDIKNRIIRATSNAFVEDPLRTYRVARFAATLGFDIDYKTYDYMKMTKDELNDLSAERVFVELDKALYSSKPSRFFETLKSADVLEVHFKEIADLINVPQPLKYHPEGDAYNHTMIVIDKIASNVSNSSIVFAGLVHDLGKALTPKEILPQHINHEDRGIEPFRNLVRRLKLPNVYQKCGAIAIKEHMRAGLFNEMRVSKKVDFIEKISKSMLGLEGMEILVNADNTKDGKIEFACVGREMLDKINAKEYPKEWDFNQIKEKLRCERISWLKKKLKFINEGESLNEL